MTEDATPRQPKIGTATYALAAASAYKVPELREVARLWWERPLPADFRPAATAKRSPATVAPHTPAMAASPAPSTPSTPAAPATTMMTYAEPGTPVEQQDPRSVRILDRIVARLGERFTVEGVRSGQGYRVVNLRSLSTDRVFTGLPIGRGGRRRPPRRGRRRGQGLQRFVCVPERQVNERLRLSTSLEVNREILIE